MRTRVASRHPAQIFPIINNEIGEGELVRVEQEGSNAKCEDRGPEVDEMGKPKRHGDVKQNEKRAHAKIDAGTGETRVQDTEGETCGRETSTSSDITGTTERQVAEDRMSVDLGREDFEDGR
jgi:hypothetical protein